MNAWSGVESVALDLLTRQVVQEAVTDDVSISLDLQPNPDGGLELSVRFPISANAGWRRPALGCRAHLSPASTSSTSG